MTTTPSQFALTMLAVEFGFKACERGDNLERARKTAAKLLGPVASTPRLAGDGGRQYGFTYPRTTSDRDRPVSEFKKSLAFVLRHMAGQEADRRKVTMRLTRDLSKSVQREETLLEVATMLDNIIVEGE